MLFETLREGRATVRRQDASVHRDGIAHDGGWAADTQVSAFSVRMVATRVLGERGFAAERFAASRHQTLVRTSARVDSSVARERARVRERLAARLANVRTFARVDADVDGQSRALDKGLAAVAKVAGEGSFLAVDASVSVGREFARNVRKRSIPSKKREGWSVTSSGYKR